MGIIYRITNSLNGKMYIGQTTRSLEERWYGHISDSKRYDYAFSRAIKKYGKEKFIIEILEQCNSIEILNEREHHWISYFSTMDSNKGYNCKSGGGNCIISEETKQKISKSKLGKKHTEETKQKLKNARTGYKFSDEAKKNMSKAQKGIKKPWLKERTISEKQKQILNEYNKTRIWTDEVKDKIGNAISLINKGKIWIHNDNTSKFIYPDEFEILKEKGYIKGRGHLKR